MVELDPENSDAQLKLSTFYFLGKKFDEAREKVDAILAKEPNNIEALLLSGSLLARENDLFEAAAAFEKVPDLIEKLAEQRKAEVEMTCSNIIFQN